MNFRRFVAAVVATVLLAGVVAVPAMAAPPSGRGHGEKVSSKFDDMGDYGWGLSDVTKMVAKGIFKGKGAGLFAPGAKITRQELAVVLVRFVDKESDATAIAQADVENLLKDIPDQAKIAAWAKPHVAELVRRHVVEADQAFRPEEEATRLDLAVLLVKALDMDAEAQAAMSKPLAFKDANQIPDALKGYVYIAVQNKIITGYLDHLGPTFRPHQGVKRIEAAVMLGRADFLVDRRRQDEVRGTVKSVDLDTSSLVVTKTDETDVTLTLTEDADVFVDSQAKTLADVAAGMTVMAKLNTDGKATYLDARSATEQNGDVNGQITDLALPTEMALGRITVDSTDYIVAHNATITRNGAAAAFSALQIGDTVSLTLTGSLVTKVVATRQESVINGTIAALTAATTNTPATITVGANVYTLADTAVITMNGDNSAFANLAVGDTVALTLSNGLVTRVAAIRAATVIEGVIAALIPAVAGNPGTPAQIELSYVQNSTSVLGTFDVTSTTKIYVNGHTAAFSALHAGDSAKVTVLNDVLTKVEVTR